MRCDFLFQEPRFGSQKNHHLRKLTNSGIVCWGRYPYLSLPVPILLYLPFISGSWISWSRAAAGCFLPGRLDTTTHRCTEWKPRSLAMRWKSSTWEISNFLPFKEWKLIFIDLAAEKRCNNKWNWIMKFDVHLSIFFWGGEGEWMFKNRDIHRKPWRYHGNFENYPSTRNSHMKQEGLKGQAVGNPQSLLLLVIFWGGIVAIRMNFVGGLPVEFLLIWTADGSGEGKLVRRRVSHPN